MRRTNYRLVLPDGPLRRFRLPPSFGDEPREHKESQPIPIMAVMGWLGVCLCSWSLASGVVDPGVLLDHTWQLPPGGSGPVMAGVFSGTEQKGGASHTPHGGAPPNVRVGSVPPLGDGASTTIAPSSLPKVTFPDVQAHRGGWGASRAPAPHPAESESAISATSDPAIGDVDSADRLPSSSERSKSAQTAAGDFSLGEMVRELVADLPGALPKAPSPKPDPFEADFAAASLPRLGSSDFADSPVPLRRAAQSDPTPAPAAQTGVRGGAIAGEGGVATWNGGCQRAFDASVQHIGSGAAVKDATQADYTRALGRLDVSACSPRGNTAIELCVAISAGRAIGATVHTTPLSPALGECLLRKVRSLAFPKSSGTDLVRTHYRVD